MASANNNIPRGNMDDTIIISESEESRDSFFEDFQNIDADIIDYGVSEDDNEQSSLVSESPPKPFTHTTARSSSATDIMHQSKKMCLRLVDIKKYPWYYSKYTKSILKSECFDTFNQNVTANGKVSLSTSIASLSTKEDLNSMTLNNNRDESAHKVQSCITIYPPRESTTPCIEKPFLNNENLCAKDTTKTMNNCLETKLKNKNIKSTKKTGTEIKSGDLENIHQQEPIKIDFKKNVGLIGMKIRTLGVNERLKEKNGVKLKQVKHRKTKQKQNMSNKSNDKLKPISCVNTLDTELSSGTSSLAEKTKRNDSNNSNKLELPENRLKENKSLKYSTKKHISKTLDVIKKCEKTQYNLDTEKIFCNNATGNNDTSSCQYNDKENTVTESYVPHTVTDDSSYNNPYIPKENDSKRECNDNMRCKPMPKSRKLDIIRKQNNKNIEKRKKNEIQRGKNEASVDKNMKLNIKRPVIPATKVEVSKKSCSTHKIAKSTIESSPIMNYNITIDQNNSKISISLDESNIKSEEENKSAPSVSFTKTEVDTSAKLGPNSKLISTQCIDRTSLVNDCSSAFIQPTNIKKMNNLLGHFTVKPDKDLCNEQKTNLLSNYGNIPENVPNTTSSMTPLSLYNHRKQVSFPQISDSRRKLALKIRPVSYINNLKNYLHVDRIKEATIEPTVSDPVKATSDTYQKHIQNMAANTEGYTHEDKRKIALAQSIISRTQHESSKFQRNIYQKIKNIEHFVKLNTVVNTAGESKEKPFLNRIQESLNPQNSQSLTDKNQIHASNIGKAYAPKFTPEINKFAMQNTQMPFRHPQSFNCETKNVFPGTMHLPYYRNSTHVDGNIPKALTTLPPFSYISQSLQNPNSFRQVRPIINPYKYQSHVYPQTPFGNHEKYSLKNEQQNVAARSANCMRNACTLQPVNASHTVPNVLGDVSRPPGICDINPLTTYWPQHTYLTPTLQPPQPVINLQENCNSLAERSIIGKNNDGIVTKINISNPSRPFIVRDIENKEESVMGKDNQYGTSCSVAVSESPVENDAPVLSKNGMMKELEKALTFRSPVKTDPKRPRQSTQNTNPLKSNRPGPLSKKVKPSNNVEDSQNLKQAQPHKRYSSPILPIPTYESILSQSPTIYKKHSLSHPLSVNENSVKINKGKTDIKTKPNKRPDRDVCKKISFAEYKKRLG